VLRLLRRISGATGRRRRRRRLVRVCCRWEIAHLLWPDPQRVAAFAVDHIRNVLASNRVAPEEPVLVSVCACCCTVKVEPQVKPLAQSHHAVEETLLARAAKEEVDHARSDGERGQKNIFQAIEPQFYLKKQQIPEDNRSRIVGVFGHRGHRERYQKKERWWKRFK